MWTLNAFYVSVSLNKNDQISKKIKECFVFFFKIKTIRKKKNTRLSE